jgi:hypothetical protein
MPKRGVRANARGPADVSGNIGMWENAMRCSLTSDIILPREGFKKKPDLLYTYR